MIHVNPICCAPAPKICICHRQSGSKTQATVFSCVWPRHCFWICGENMNIRMRLCLYTLISVCLSPGFATNAFAQLQFQDAEMFGADTGRESLPPPPETNQRSNLGSDMRPIDSFGGYNQPAPLQSPQYFNGQTHGAVQTQNQWVGNSSGQSCNCGSCNQCTSLWEGYCCEDCSNCGCATDCCSCNTGLFGGGLRRKLFGRNMFGNSLFGGNSSNCCDPCCSPARMDTFTIFAGIDGSKQPQDFGVNANLGGLFQMNYSAPIFPGSSIGFQVGSSASYTGNAVQVYELLGESTDRFQSFNTVGIFQRTQIGFSWGAVYDLLYQDSFDEFYLGQVRVRASMDVGHQTEIGATFNISTRGDSGQFNNTTVYLDPIDQYHIYCRRYWQSGVNSACWIGIADEHSEDNIVTGTLPVKNDTILFGADFMAPLNGCMALYGATNLLMPADTGAVDAFLGIEFSPQGIARSRGRTNPFRAYMPVAASPFFTTNLTR